MLARLLARSFYDDPFAVWIEPDDDRRLANLEEQFLTFFEEVFVPRRQIDVLGGDEPFAQAVWAPPGTYDLTPEEGERVGARLAGVLGDEMGRVGQALDEVEGRRPPGEYWYLEFLGVDPDLQRQGHGGRLLASGLERVDGPAYLWTAKERNLPFYEAHGFEVTWSETIPGDGPPVWGMWRP